MAKLSKHLPYYPRKQLQEELNRREQETSDVQTRQRKRLMLLELGIKIL